MKKLKFNINRGLDELMADQFLNIKGGGVDFGTGILKTHPNLKKAALAENIAIKKVIINKYFANYYKKNQKLIQKKVQLVRYNWKKVEGDYAHVTEEYFNDYKFPNGMYVAYASIINCNPRFLESKTFQFYYKKSVADTIHTIAHELLHFIFYDFVNKKLRKETRRLTEDQLWTLSEIFNVVVLRSSLYGKIIDKKSVRPYPDHKKYLKRFEKEFKKSKNAKDFILRTLSIVK